MPRSTAITDLLPSYAGLLMMAEITALGEALDNPERPVMAIVGGAKVSTKIDVLTNLVARMDQLVVGGGMATTFLLAQGKEIGTSFCEPDFVATAKEIMALAEQSGCEIVLPTDEVVAMKLEENAQSWVCSVDEVPADAMILDFGPESVADLKRRLAGDPHRAVEWPARRLRDQAVRRGNPRARPRGRPPDQGGEARQRRRRRRHGEGAQRRRGRLRPHLCLDRGGRFLEWLGGHELPAVLALCP